MATRENQFPYRVQDITDLPQSFQKALQPLLKPGEPVHSILMLPPQPFLKRGGVPRQALLSTTRGILHVKDGKPPVAAYLPGESLLYVHLTLVLLYGRLELASEADGRLAQVVAEYNTVGQELLNAALAQFMQATYGMIEGDTDIEDQNRAVLQKLEAQSFKFMNGLRLYALRPGERLLGYVFQPRIRQPFLRYFSRPIAPASMLALTDRSVILIEEDKSWGASYGWVITLCPREVVLTVESKPMQERHKLSVLLLRNHVSAERSLILEQPAALACKALWSSQTSQEG